MRSICVFIAEGVLIMGAFFVTQTLLRSDSEASALAWPELPRWDDGSPGGRHGGAGGAPPPLERRGAGEAAVDWDGAEILRRLGPGRLEDGEAAVWREGQELRFACRSTAERVFLDGSLQSPLRRLGDLSLGALQEGARPGEISDIRVLAVHIPALDRAAISYALLPVRAGRLSRTRAVSGIWRGPGAPRAPLRSQTLAGTIEHETFSSLFLLERRTIAIYRPPTSPRAGEAGPVLYITGGPPLESLVPYIDPLIAAGELPAVTIVDAGLDAETGHADGEPQFAAFESFFYEEVMRRAERTAGSVPHPTERVLFGTSKGAGLALALALRDRERPGGRRFDRVIGFSVSASRPLEPSAPGMSFYFLAGTLETGPYDLTRSWARRLTGSGASVAFHERVAGHDPVMWREALPDALRWALH